MSSTPDSELERRLRQAGAAFVEAHDEAELAIREAADAGMPVQAISRASGLAPETVAIFLRARTE